MASIGRSVWGSCINCCSLLVERDEDGRAERVKGDPASTLRGGYTYIEGRSQVADLRGPRRLTTSLNRGSDCTLIPISTHQSVHDRYTAHGSSGSLRGTVDRQLLGDDGCRERERDTNARRVWQVSQDTLRRQPADRKRVAMASLIVGISHGGLGDLPGPAPMPTPILGGRGQLCR
jgi:hypothetical protein